MNYASTAMAQDGTEAIAVILPLDAVPLWDPQNAPQGTYLVPDDAAPGWVRQSDGSFVPSNQGGE
jgi:hypothetical protein